jgi:hypothetical protein
MVTLFVEHGPPVSKGRGADSASAIGAAFARSDTA